MKFAYADPPYPGQSAKHYADHPDYAGEVDHADLIEELMDYDGWCLHTSSPALPTITELLADEGLLARDGDYRLMAWVKPFAAFKKNVSVAYAWEPVIVKPARRFEGFGGDHVGRDWIAEGITLKRGLTGAKPERVCHWLFEVMGMRPDDELDDLFPGSGAVTRAWDSWRSQLKLEAA